MPRQTYTAIMAALKTKLEGILDSQSAPIFKQVYDYAEGDFSGYPVAVLRELAGEGRIIDTHRNERVFIFQLSLYQEQGKKTKAEAAASMRAAVDAVMAAFDKDASLNSLVARVEVVPVTLDFNVAAAPFNFATFTLRAVDLVNNYP